MIGTGATTAYAAALARAREEYAMYEEYYGFTEKPFSLTPDPKYLYKSTSHANAFELLQYAIRRREGFVVVTGDIGTGKTTLCRAILEQLDRKTFTALVLNPFLSEEDLLKLILQDFGVVSRDEIRRGRLAGVTKQELIETLNEFLLSLLPLRAGALLIIDEAQNLPLQVLEQIRILSNLETDKEKLLQILLVGQPNLKDMLRTPQLRQLDQRVSIRYELKPLSREETGAYVGHRLAIAGGGAAVAFAPKALDLVHRSTGGIPRLINLICDRALLDGYSQRTNRILPEQVRRAAESLDLRAPRRSALTWLRQRAAAFAAGASLASILAVGGAAAWQQHASAAARTSAGAARLQVPPGNSAVETGQNASPLQVSQPAAAAGTEVSATAPQPAAPVPAAYSVLVASFRVDSEAGLLSSQLRELGYRATVSRSQYGERGVWHQVIAGPYHDLEAARRDEARLRQMPAYADARLIQN